MAGIQSIAIVGIGNVLMGDDALGPYVIKRIESEYRLPPYVSLIEAGTPGLDLIALFFEFDILVLVDTIRAAGAPGEIRKYNREDLLKKAPILSVSPHDPGLREALLTLQIARETPQEATLIGVIAENVDLGRDLSDSVKGAVPHVIEEVLAELERLGVKAEKKSPPDKLDIWWK
jgi:hydrogenase maturation protease